MKRRSFLKVVGAAAGAVAAGVPATLEAAENETFSDPSGLPRRALGRTKQRISVIGFPGLSLTHDEYDQDRCTRALHDAFEHGVNYFDNAPAYGKGKCETRMGIGLQGIPRDKYFLACKTKMRDADGARQEMENSLKLLKTDHFDLYQLHHLVQPADVKKALGPGGALEGILKARDEGKVRYIGFSAHTTKAALEAMRGFNFDTAMFPINYVEFFTRGFGSEVMALAREKGTSVISIKPMNAGAWPKGAERKRKWWYRCTEDQESVNLAWKFALSQSGVIAGIPPSWLDLVEKAIEAGRSYKPITADETEKLKKMAEGCGSIFKREEDQVVLGRPYHSPYPHHPHECSEAMS